MVQGVAVKNYGYLIFVVIVALIVSPLSAKQMGGESIFEN